MNYQQDSTTGNGSLTVSDGTFEYKSDGSTNSPVNRNVVWVAFCAAIGKFNLQQKTISELGETTTGTMSHIADGRKGISWPTWEKAISGLIQMSSPASLYFWRELTPAVRHQMRQHCKNKLIVQFIKERDKELAADKDAMMAEAEQLLSCILATEDPDFIKTILKKFAPKAEEENNVETGIFIGQVKYCNGGVLIQFNDSSSIESTLKEELINIARESSGKYS